MISLTCVLVIEIFKSLEIISTQKEMLSVICLLSCIVHIGISGGFPKDDREHWPDNQIDPN